MLIYEYKCDDCSAVFDVLRGAQGAECVSCDGSNVTRNFGTIFAANKQFCPHDKKIEVSEVKAHLTDVVGDSEHKCGGCGTDGAEGKCAKGGCGSGGCGSGGCGGACSGVK